LRFAMFLSMDVDTNIPLTERVMLLRDIRSIHVLVIVDTPENSNNARGVTFAEFSSRNLITGRSVGITKQTETLSKTSLTLISRRRRIDFNMIIIVASSIQRIIIVAKST
jgi:hypothetical protein